MCARIKISMKYQLKQFSINIKSSNEIETFDQRTDNIWYCKQAWDVNDYPHAGLISYLSCFI